MIDLHTHTTASDGTDSPAELVDAALKLGLLGLAITDHDTFDGVDEAAPLAAARGLRLLRGIEVSARLDAPGRGRSRTVHILGYFPAGPGQGFRDWVGAQQEIRRERNERMAAKLREIGLDITLDEVRRVGRNMTGRPHFARVLVAKGYAGGIQDAFDRYVGEGAAAYVEKHDPGLEETVQAIRAGGGAPSLAHPVRLDLSGDDEADLADRLADAGLLAIEVHHSDHDAARRDRYRVLAARFGLAITGGSDYHGANKPGVELGSGRSGNVRVPVEVLDRLLTVSI